MKGMRKLQSPHAAPEISLPESKCSLLRRAHPNDRSVKSTITTRGAGNQPARKQMLAPAEGIPK